MQELDADTLVDVAGGAAAPDVTQTVRELQSSIASLADRRERGPDTSMLMMAMMVRRAQAPTLVAAPAPVIRVTARIRRW